MSKTRRIARRVRQVYRNATGLEKAFQTGFDIGYDRGRSMKVQISRKPESRYLKLHDGNYYDRKSDTIVIKEAIETLIIEDFSHDKTRTN